MEWTSIIGIALWALIPGFIAKHKGRSFWGYYFLSFLISPLITLIISLFLSKIEPDAIVDTKAQSINAPAVPSVSQKTVDITTSSSVPVDSSKKEEIPSAPKKIMFCRKCGFKLIEGSEFCSNCGVPIATIDHQNE